MARSSVRVRLSLSMCRRTPSLVAIRLASSATASTRQPSRHCGRSNGGTGQSTKLHATSPRFAVSICPPCYWLSEPLREIQRQEADVNIDNLDLNEDSLLPLILGTGFNDPYPVYDHLRSACPVHRDAK